MLAAGRFWLLAGSLLLWLTLVCGRLVQVQILQHERWSGVASRQQEKTIEVEEPRGDITSGDGRLLASSLERVAVYVNPSRIPREQRPEVAARLSEIVALPAAEISSRIAQHEGFFYLAKEMDPQIAPAVARLRQRGVGTLRTEHRVYPHGTLAGPVVGFVNADGKGQAGLEAFYERTLRGVPSVYRLIRDGKSLPTALDLRLEKPGRAGLGLVLALDSRIQMVVEQELAATIATVKAKRAGAVVMDPTNGSLLALVSVPSYDPDDPGGVETWVRRNIPVEVALEPGSTFKPLMVAGAIEAGVLSATEMVDCSGGGVQVANHFFRDHARYGFLSVRDLLAHSSNTGAIRVTQRLTRERLDEFIVRMGFGQRTGVELPAESPGIYRGPQRWSALSQASLGMGQEIIVTPLQLAQAYAAIANGGFLVNPTLVRETRDRDGDIVTPYRPPERHRVLSPSVANTLAEMLTAVVDEGTAMSAQLPGYRVAGKTGTAQKPVEGSYAAGLHAAWFAGFFPVPSARLVIVVCIDEPRTNYWASDVAVPTFRRIAERLVSILVIPPTPGVTA